MCIGVNVDLYVQSATGRQTLDDARRRMTTIHDGQFMTVHTVSHICQVSQ